MYSQYLSKWKGKTTEISNIYQDYRDSIHIPTQPQFLHTSPPIQQTNNNSIPTCEEPTQNLIGTSLHSTTLNTFSETNNNINKDQSSLNFTNGSMPFIIHGVENDNSKAKFNSMPVLDRRNNDINLKNFRHPNSLSMISKGRNLKDICKDLNDVLEQLPETSQKHISDCRTLRAAWRHITWISKEESSQFEYLMYVPKEKADLFWNMVRQEFESRRQKTSTVANCLNWVVPRVQHAHNASRI